MSRELFLIRHAQSQVLDFNQKDRDRVLTPDGCKDAMRLGHLLKSKELFPDYILCSSAERTKETANYICEQIGYDPNKIYYTEELYESSVRIMLHTINGLDDSYDKVFLIAHNPAISYLAEYVTGDMIGNVSPGGMIHLDLEDSNWSDLAQDNATLIKYYDPIEL